VMDLQKYRESDLEKSRIADIFRIMPRGRKTILEIGARDGFFSRRLVDYFDEVTALDLEEPPFEFPRVTTVAGNATRLQFQDQSFDCVLCAEVLEHIPQLEEACRELARVARHEIVIGVPFRQDTRVGRTTCNQCGKTNPPWAHVNSFDEQRLRGLFPGWQVKERSFVGSTKVVTNSLSATLMNLAGNPWGTYEQDEPCIYCGAPLSRPTAPRSYASRAYSGLAVRLDRFQTAFAQEHGNWIHIVFARNSG
jgi:SAM-dependent methyltransferase